MQTDVSFLVQVDSSLNTFGPIPMNALGDDRPRSTPAIDDIRDMSIIGRDAILGHKSIMDLENATRKGILGAWKTEGRQVSNFHYENKHLEGKRPPGGVRHINTSDPNCFSMLT
jgi:hypothetical protein